MTDRRGKPLKSLEQVATRRAIKTGDKPDRRKGIKVGYTKIEKDGQAFVTDDDTGYGYVKIGDPYEFIDNSVEDISKAIQVLAKYQEGEARYQRAKLFGDIKAVLAPYFVKNKAVLNATKTRVGHYYSIAGKYWVGDEALAMSLLVKIVRHAKKQGYVLKVPTDGRPRTGSTGVKSEAFQDVFASLNLKTSNTGDGRQTTIPNT